MKRVLAASHAAHSLFPNPDLDSLLTYIRAIWQELKHITPVWWNHTKETKLVEGFYLALNNDTRLIEHGIGFGHLILEAVDVELAPNGMPRQRGRTDVRFTYGGWMGPVLVLEFKRLNNGTRLRHQYIINGLDRFISGKYSPESDFGVMVGLVDGFIKTEKNDLIAKISEPKIFAAIQGRPMSRPTHGDPSLNTPALDFDTLHGRQPGCSADEIRIGHMLLER